MATLVRKGKIAEIKYPYDLGWLDNLKSVLGPKPWLWLWPQEMKSDGLSFPVNKKVGGEFDRAISGEGYRNGSGSSSEADRWAEQVHGEGVHGGINFGEGLSNQNAPKRREAGSIV